MLHKAGRLAGVTPIDRRDLRSIGVMLHVYDIETPAAILGAAEEP